MLTHQQLLIRDYKMTIEQQSVINCLSLLKKHLKSNGMTYRILAEKMSVAEITVKRLLNSKQVSMAKMMELCRYAGISLPELLEELSTTPPVHYCFSDKQDEVFAKKPHLLAYFSTLFFDAKTPETIEKEYQLSKTSTHFYLRALENIGLLQVSAKNNITFLIKPPIGFAPDSQVIKNQIVQGVQKVSEALVNDKLLKNSYFILKPMQLREDDIYQMLNELSDVINRYAQLSEAKETLKNKAIVKEMYQLCLVGHTIENESTNIVNVSNIHLDI